MKRKLLIGVSLVLITLNTTTVNKKAIVSEVHPCGVVWYDANGNGHWRVCVN